MIDDEVRLKLLNDFATSLSIVKGGNMKVLITHNITTVTPRDKKEGMRYEDCVKLDGSLEGANEFIMFLSRNGYNIVRKKKCHT